MDLTSEGCQADSSEASSSIKCSCQDKINSRPGHALLCQCVSTLTRRHHCCRVWKRVFCKQIIHCILCLGFLAESISSFGDDVCCVDRCHLGKNFIIEVFTFFFFLMSEHLNSWFRTNFMSLKGCTWKPQLKLTTEFSIQLMARTWQYLERNNIVSKATICNLNLYKPQK